MSNVVLSLMIDVTMAVLLIVTIFYCRKLNLRIRVLQDSRSELAQIIREFDESTERATKSIAEIHEATRRLSENIQHKIDKANFLVDDLQTMIEKGNRVAGQVEGGGTTASRPSPAALREQDISKAHRRSGVESIVTGAAMNPGTAPEGGVGRRARQRSRAEQEVLDALKKQGE